MLTHSDSLAQLALAVARAQAKYLSLGKDKSANISSRTGTSFSYDYADLADTFDAIRGALTEEHIATFQPVSMNGERVTVTTLLVHGDSGEWIRDELSMPVTDSHDARAIGSAITYAKRYALQSMTGVAPRGEDDDAESARGGNHEIRERAEVPAAAPKAKLCPLCGADAIIPSKFGGWYCFDKKGGCKARWPAGPHPADLPPAPTPGIVSPERAAEEADRLFPDDLVTLGENEAEELVKRVQARFKMLTMSPTMQKKLWAEHVAGAEFVSAQGASLDGLWALLNALGVTR